MSKQALRAAADLAVAQFLASGKTITVLPKGKASGLTKPKMRATHAPIKAWMVTRAIQSDANRTRNRAVSLAHYRAGLPQASAFSR